MGRTLGIGTAMRSRRAENAHSPDELANYPQNYPHNRTINQTRSDLT